MDEKIELTNEQKEVKFFINLIVKIVIYVPFFMILILTVFVIVKGFKEGFY